MIQAMVFLFSSLTFGSVHQFECTFEQFPADQKLTFQITNLADTANREFNEVFTDYEGEPNAFTYTSTGLEWLWLMLTYDELNYLESDDDGNLIIPIDDISCDIGKIKLYKNNDFKFGYLKIEHNCSGPDQQDTYSKMKCEITEQ